MLYIMDYRLFNSCILSSFCLLIILIRHKGALAGVQDRNCKMTLKVFYAMAFYTPPGVEVDFDPYTPLQGRGGFASIP